MAGRFWRLQAVRFSDSFRTEELWRLQAQWPTLTDTQRLGLTWLMCGQGLVEYAAQHRVNFRVLSMATKDALRRLDHPGRYKMHGRYSPCSVSGCDGRTRANHGQCVRCRAKALYRERGAVSPSH